MHLDLSYPVVCPLAYLLAGTIKFSINSVRAGRLAFARIGLGGFPSTHTAIVSSAAWRIGVAAGFGTPVFAVAVALTMIVIIDALDLRRKVGLINRVLKSELPRSEEVRTLREQVGHRPLEILGGLMVGGLAALLAGAFA